MKNDDWKTILAVAVLFFVITCAVGACTYMERKMEIEKMKIEKGIK